MILEVDLVPFSRQHSTMEEKTGSDVALIDLRVSRHDRYGIAHVFWEHAWMQSLAYGT